METEATGREALEPSRKILAVDDDPAIRTTHWVEDRERLDPPTSANNQSAAGRSPVSPVPHNSQSFKTKN